MEAEGGVVSCQGMAFNGTPFAPYKRPQRGYRRRKGGLPCDGCNKTCSGWDYYMVHGSVWVEEAGLTKNILGYDERECLLCLACLSTRLGRKLEQADFPRYPINNSLHVYFDTGSLELAREAHNRVWAR